MDAWLPVGTKNWQSDADSKAPLSMDDGIVFRCRASPVLVYKNNALPPEFSESVLSRVRWYKMMVSTCPTVCFGAESVSRRGADQKQRKQHNNTCDHPKQRNQHNAARDNIFMLHSIFCCSYIQVGRCVFITEQYSLDSTFNWILIVWQAKSIDNKKFESFHF